MRCLRAIVLLTCVLAAALARADETFPYKAYVAAEDVYIRSGPGKNYYPTDKLARGTEVEVYRHDPGGWCAIRPPQGSFSWVTGSQVRITPNQSNVAEVAGKNVVAYVGSRFSDVRDVTQVRLNRGELVEVLGEKRFVAERSTTAETWYRVAPPAGEFRWVSAKFISRQGTGTPVASSESARGEKSARVSPPSEGVVLASATSTANDGASAVQHADYVVPENTPTTGAVVATAATAPAGSNRPRAGGNGEVVVIPEAGAPPSAPATPAPTALQSELDSIGLQLSLMIAEEPSTWQFDALKSRANVALASSRTALERGRANAVLREIQQYEGIKRQYLDLSNLRQQTDRQSQVLAQAAEVAAQSVADPAADLAKFDGVGRLTPVVSKRAGAPRYALTDATGGVVTFVTPDADLTLQPYVGRVVGLSGVRGYMPQLNKPHLTAKRLTELNPTALR